MKLNAKVFDILKNGSREERLYICDKEPVYFAVYYFTEFFTHPIAPFQYDFYNDYKNLMSGDLDEAAWIVFREGAKTSIAKILLTHAICYRKKRFINYDSYDKTNAEAALFDVVVWLQSNEKLIADFGNLYYKKRHKDTIEEAKLKRINNFITENGIKVEAYSTQESTRGRIYNNFRPDWFILDDIENNKTKESYPITQKIISHIDEMKSGLSANGSILYLGNYISEEGVIAHVLESVKRNPKGISRNIPVVEKGKIAWPQKYVKTDKEEAEANKKILQPEKRVISLEAKRRSLGETVFETEMMNNPAKSGDLVFNRAKIRDLLKLAQDPIEVVGDVKIWERYDHGHTYASGGDTSEGKGLDSNALVTIDFSFNPAKVVATFEDNKISPTAFAHVMKKVGNLFGGHLLAPELNNTGFATVAELQNIYDNIYIRVVKGRTEDYETKEYGFRTTPGNKYDIIGQLKMAVEDGHLIIPDEALLWELYYYRKQDLGAMKMQEGMTRHFDKLIALAIAWEMRKHATYESNIELGPKPPEYS